jgi:hypothetical protein
VYEKPLSEQEPVVCVDEKPVVLHQEVRPPLAMKPGCVARRDSEYQRGGTANVFCGVEPKAGRHFPKVTATRSSPEFADYLLDIAASYPGGRHHPLGDGQPEFAYPQGRGGALWREGRRLAVEPVHSALHPQAWQLAEPSGDRHQPVLPAMLGPTPDRRSSFSAQGNSGLEAPYESRPSSDPVGIYSQEGPTHFWLHNHAVTALVVGSWPPVRGASPPYFSPLPIFLVRCEQPGPFPCGGGWTRCRLQICRNVLLAAHAD